MLRFFIVDYMPDKVPCLTQQLGFFFCQEWCLALPVFLVCVTTRRGVLSYTLGTWYVFVCSSVDVAPLLPVRVFFFFSWNNLFFFRVSYFRRGACRVLGP